MSDENDPPSEGFEGMLARADRELTEAMAETPPNIARTYVLADIWAWLTRAKGDAEIAARIERVQPSAAAMVRARAHTAIETANDGMRVLWDTELRFGPCPCETEESETPDA